MCSHGIQGCLAVGGGRHRIPLRRQQASDVGAHISVVIGEQHGLAGTGLPPDRRRDGGRLREVAKVWVGCGKPVQRLVHKRLRPPHLDLIGERGIDPFRRQVRSSKRQGDNDPGAVAFMALDPYRAAMELYELLHQGKADAAAFEAAAAGAFHAMEALKKPG